MTDTESAPPAANDWSTAIQTLFGESHPEMLGAEEATHASNGICDLIRYWELRHGALRIATRGSGRRTDFKAGTFLLLLVESGSARVELFNVTRDLRRSDALLFTAIEPLVLTTSANFAGAWFELPIWWLVDLFGGGLSGARERLDGALGSTSMLRAVLELMRRRNTPDGAEDLVSLFGDVLHRCLLIAGRGDAEPEGQFDRINRFIAWNYRQEGLSPQHAAAALSCSLSSIHKTCAAAGTTFGTMVSTMRLSVAAFRLARDPQRISEIAFDCGFTSFSHFCHAFKARFGLTANEARRRVSPPDARRS
ncbi:helix-turn-helix domain-containing protein [Sphingomonas sp.]|uniref:helix-turn-helix domain-containing protein n=1 Tax=Sphingomonas sp. TaxID=28214 RepID=UPI003D6D6AA3